MSSSNPGKDLSLARRGAAFASMLGTSGILGYECLRHAAGSDTILGVAFAGLLAVGGLGLTARNLTTQVISRGMAWLVAAPTGIAVAIEATKGHATSAPIMALFATAASALLLARPALHTKDAHAQFHPVQARRSLLAGSTATAATAFLTGGIALELVGDRGLFRASTLGFAVLSLALLAISTAVVRMRAWGVLLGAAVSAVLLAASAMVRGPEGVALALFAAPMISLHLIPIVLARWGSASMEPSARAARLEPAPASVSGVRYRVATLEDELDAAIDADREELPQERRKVHV